MRVAEALVVHVEPRQRDVLAARVEHRDAVRVERRDDEAPAALVVGDVARALEVVREPAPVDDVVPGICRRRDDGQAVHDDGDAAADGREAAHRCVFLGEVPVPRARNPRR